MKAAIFRGPGNIAVEERPRPSIQEPGDAIVRIVRACVCGSDLWFYRGISDLPHGGVGHEFIGIVHEVGEAVQHVSAGDFVIAPFAFSDGTCPNCQAGFQTACVDVGFFGQGGDGDGGQAEYVRVPMADGTLYQVPHGDYSDEMLASLLTLSDVMGTGYHAAVSAQVKEGDTVAVVGDGAVGLCGVLAARMLGAARIIIMSRHPDRQALAREFGATDIVDERGEAALARIMELTDGVGVDAVLECVGTQESNQTCFAVARAGAIVGRVGVPHGVEIPVEGTFFRNVGMRGGPAPVRAYMDALLPEVLSGRINPGRVFDLVIDLDHVSDGYAAMDERRSIKALIKVSEL